MVQYLVDSCGFDQEKATEASKLLKGIQSRQQPDSVLAFLKSYGFDDASVKKLLRYSPKCLLLDVEKTLAPKFRAFEDLGLSPSDIVHLVRSNPRTVRIKHERTVPKIEFWQGLLGSKDALVKLFKRNRAILSYSIEKKIQPNLELLRECGLDGPKHTSVLRYCPQIAAQNADFLKTLISRAEDLGSREVQDANGIVPELRVVRGQFCCGIPKVSYLHTRVFDDIAEKNGVFDK
ncbi:uncharacterized protein LOC121994868 [Zingiber officinale]|uniref:uncharacterized protein LOC121994868 n=1 Tax=Zingiber officinale TaxID=94328 RepID=UPI001C4ABF34|nr:uncharacterized protein LOC121994868 [Zingiber officinale]